MKSTRLLAWLAIAIGAIYFIVPLIGILLFLSAWPAAITDRVLR